MKGRIIKGIAGFYYVDTGESGIYECRAKGVFRKDGKKPLVGDHVEIEILSGEEKTGNLTEIFARKNELIRPAVANVDQALVIFALENPKPNIALLDRFLVMMEQQRVPAAICFISSRCCRVQKTRCKHCCIKQLIPKRCLLWVCRCGMTVGCIIVRP